MCCSSLQEMTLQLQTLQNFFLSMLNAILILLKVLLLTEISTLLLIFDKKYVSIKLSSNIFLQPIILKQTVKVKLWIILLKTTCGPILQKIKQFEWSYFLLRNLSIIIVIITLHEWVLIDYFTALIVRFELMLWKMSLREEYQ